MYAKSDAPRTWAGTGLTTTRLEHAAASLSVAGASGNLANRTTRGGNRKSKDKHEATTGLYLGYRLNGVDTECNMGPGTAPNSCGIRVHAGSSCDKPAGMRLFNIGKLLADPWVNTYYTSTPGVGCARRGARHSRGLCRKAKRKIWLQEETLVMSGSRRL